MRNWKVSYQDLRRMGNGSRIPFFKHVTVVSADSRAEAIQRLKSRFSPPSYGKYRASPTNEPASLTCLSSDSLVVR